MKLVNFLDDLKEISKAESQNTKEIIKKLEKETEGFKDVFTFSKLVLFN